LKGKAEEMKESKHYLQAAVVACGVGIVMLALMGLLLGILGVSLYVGDQLHAPARHVVCWSVPIEGVEEKSLATVCVVGTANEPVAELVQEVMKAK
jgi:hypothetical protein